MKSESLLLVSLLALLADKTGSQPRQDHRMEGEKKASNRYFVLNFNRPATSSLTMSAVRQPRSTKFPSTQLLRADSAQTPKFPTPRLPKSPTPQSQPKKISLTPSCPPHSPASPYSHPQNSLLVVLEGEVLAINARLYLSLRASTQ